MVLTCEAVTSPPFNWVIMNGILFTCFFLLPNSSQTCWLTPAQPSSRWVTSYIMSTDIILILLHVAFQQFSMDRGCVSLCFFNYVSLWSHMSFFACGFQETENACGLFTLAVYGFVFFPELYQALDNIRLHTPLNWFDRVIKCRCRSN